LNLQIYKECSIQRYVQSGKSYASVTKTESKQSNANQRNQGTQEKITITITPSPKQLITSVTQKLKYYLDTLYHTMHPDGKAYGEIALIIKSDIKHYEIGKFQKEFLHANSIVVEDHKMAILLSQPHTHCLNIS